jgi:hypothetical protein
VTLTIDIPPELEHRLQDEAARKGVAAEDYARMLLEERLLPGDQGKPPTQGEGSNAWSVLKTMMGTVEGPPDWSSELDHYLYGTPKRGEARTDEQ